MGTSLQASNARPHSIQFILKVPLFPTIIRPFFALVHATLRRLASSTKPISPSMLQRTVVKMTISASRPWNPSIVLTAMLFGKFCFSNFTWAEYGESTAMIKFCSFSRSLAGSWEFGWRDRSSDIIYWTRSACALFDLDARPTSSSAEHGTNARGNIFPTVF